MLNTIGSDGIFSSTWRTTVPPFPGSRSYADNRLAPSELLNQRSHFADVFNH
jgi:hypothetical protein